MLISLGLSIEEWEGYWNHMKDYRDELVAHYEMDTDVSKYPDLEIAMRSSYFYYDYLQSTLNQEVLAEPLEGLEEYSNRFYESSKKIAAKAIEATNGIKETVY